MKVDIYNQKGSKVNKKIELKNSVFAIEPNEHSVYLVIKAEQASKRQGTSKSKSKSDVRGTGSKPWKQKGTGRARVGRIRNPSRVSGGTAFGPETRTYKLKINKKVKNLARKSALSHKIKEKSLIILEKFDLKKPRTKDFIDILSNLSIDNKKSLFFLSDFDNNIHLSSNNIRNSIVKNVQDINTYDIVNADNIVFVEDSIEKLNTILK